MAEKPLTSSIAAPSSTRSTLAQEQHVDLRRDSADWPLVGFILMIDELRPTRKTTAFLITRRGPYQPRLIEQMA